MGCGKLGFRATFLDTKEFALEVTKLSDVCLTEMFTRHMKANPCHRRVFWALLRSWRGHPGVRFGKAQAPDLSLGFVQ